MTESEQHQTNEMPSQNQKKTSRRYISKTVLDFIPVLVGILGLSATIIGALLAFRQDPKSSEALIKRADLQIAINDIKGQIIDLNENLERVRNQIRDLGKPINPFDQSIQLNALNNSIAESQKRLASLEGAILTNPEKALAIPLIRKDIDSLKEVQQTNVVASKQDIDRIYDQSRWFIGLMITSSIGIIALAISNYFKK